MKTKKENTVKKKTIGLPLNEDIYKALEQLSADYGASIATVCRMIIVDYLKRYKGNLLSRKEEK